MVIKASIPEKLVPVVMDGCHGATSNRDPFNEREDTLGYAGLKMVRQSDSSTWDIEVCGLGFLCLAPHREKARIVMF